MSFRTGVRFPSGPYEKSLENDGFSRLFLLYVKNDPFIIDVEKHFFPYIPIIHDNTDKYPHNFRLSYGIPSGLSRAAQIQVVRKDVVHAHLSLRLH